MAGKSLDDVWRQMQAQQAAQQQQRIAQERALYEQRERQRQEYLERTRMYEKLSLNAVSVASAAAGGSGNRQTNSDYPEVNAQSYIITWLDINYDLWKFVVYNFETGQLSDIHETDLDNNWNLNSDERTVQSKGFTLEFQNNNDDTYRLYFINANGTLVGEKNLDTREDFQQTERAQGYLGLLNGVSTFYHFDGDNVRTHTFEGIDISNIEIDDSNGYDVTKDGSMIVEAPNDEKFYIARPNGDLVEITDYLLGNDVYYLSNKSDFIIADFQLGGLKIISQDGTLKNSFDVSEFNIDYSDEFDFYGDNCAISTHEGQDYKLVVSYDGDSNQFVSLTFPITNNFSIDYNTLSWYNPISSFGKNLIISSYNESTTDNLGRVVTDLNIWWLPKGATEFNHIDLTSVGEVSFVYGNNDFSNERSFSLGENGIFMYAVPESEIIVGFLGENGFSTQSTGILSASCSNIWGHAIGQHSFAIFDLDYMNDRIWQFYDSNSIVAQHQTTESWNWGDDSSMEGARNGTLAVIDSNETSNSFIYTTEVGLVAGPTGLGQVLNSINYGINTGLTYEYQVITQYTPSISSETIDGFYILSKSGLSEYVEMFAGISPSSPYTINDESDYCIGSELISFRFTDINTNTYRYMVYNISTLELIDDYIDDKDQSEYYPFDNRFYYQFNDDNGLINIRLVSKFGLQTLDLNTTELNREANDVVDND